MYKGVIKGENVKQNLYYRYVFYSGKVDFCMTIKNNCIYNIHLEIVTNDEICFLVA